LTSELFVGKLAQQAIAPIANFVIDKANWIGASQICLVQLFLKRSIFWLCRRRVKRSSTPYKLVVIADHASKMLGMVGYFISKLCWGLHEIA